MPLACCCHVSEHWHRLLTSQVYCRPDLVPFPWHELHLMLRASDSFLQQH